MGTPGQVLEQAALSGYDQAYAYKQQRKDMLSDEDRRLKAQDLIDAKHGALAKLPTLRDQYGENSQQYKDALQAITQSQYNLGQLYHPDKAPGAIQKDFHWLLDKMHNIKPSSPASTTSQAQDITINTPAAPISTPELPSYQTIDVPRLPSQGGSVIGTEPAIPAATVQGMSSPITIPSGLAPVTVTKATPVPWGKAQLLKKQAASMQNAQQEAGLLAAGAGLTPEQEAMSQYRAKESVLQAQTDDTLKLAKNLGLSDSAMEELKQQLAGLKNIAPKAVAGPAGAPYKGADGRYYKAVMEPDGRMGSIAMPPDWKPTTKAVAGGILNSKQYGYIKIWVDPYNPSKIVGFQKITPGRQYTGSTSSSSATDAAGITTTSSRSTMPTNQAPIDIDLTGSQQVPDNFTGDELPESPVAAGQTNDSFPSGIPNKSTNPSAAPPRTVSVRPTSFQPRATPAQLRSQVPAPPRGSTVPLALDANGHIPTNAPYNGQLISAANQLIDGMDISKLPLPAKDKEAAAELAAKYGYGGQGLFNPQQKLQIKEASTFLRRAISSPALSVLDSRISRDKIIAALNNSEGHAGWTDSFIARNFNLNPKEAEFLRMYRQLTGTISGLASLTRPGRPTEAGIKRLMFELPNPNESHSAADAKARLQRLIDEINIATNKGTADDLLSGAASSTSSNSGQITTEQLMDLYKKANQNSSSPK